MPSRLKSGHLCACVMCSRGEGLCLGTLMERSDEYVASKREARREHKKSKVECPKCGARPGEEHGC